MYLDSDLIVARAGLAITTVALVAGIARWGWLFAAPYRAPIKPDAKRLMASPRAKLLIGAVGSATVGMGAFSILESTTLASMPTIVKIIADIALFVLICAALLMVSLVSVVQSIRVHGESRIWRNGRLSVQRSNLLEMGMLLAFAAMVCHGAGYMLPADGLLPQLSADAVNHRLCWQENVAEWTVGAGIFSVTIRRVVKLPTLAVSFLSFSGFHWLYDEVRPSDWRIDEFFRARGSIIPDADVMRHFVEQAAQVETLAVIGLALAATLILAPLLDRAADAISLSNRDIGIFRGSAYAVMLGLFLFVYSRASVHGHLGTSAWIPSSAALLGVVAAVLGDRWWQAARHAWAMLKTAGGKHRELLLPILVLLLLTGAASGFHALSYYSLSAFVLGFFGALGAGVTKGPEQATEAQDFTQAAVFD